MLFSISAVFPNKFKISLDSRSCELETFIRPNKFSPDNWSIADVYLVITTKRIVGPMWLGIFPDLPVLYRTCLVSPTLLGKTVSAIKKN